MKYVLTILLSVCMLCQCLVKLGVVAYYEYNKQYIAANLCENRAKPLLKCCGKCYLNKQLKKADKNSDEGSGKSNPNGKNQWVETSPFLVPEIAFLTAYNFLASNINPLAYYQQMPLHKVSLSIFHPPQASFFPPFIA